MSVNSMKVRNGITFKPVAQSSTPENGDVYYDSTANLFYFYQNGAWVNYLTLSNYRAGTTTISNGGTSVSVTFSSAMASTSYAVTATISNTTDTNPQFIPVTITAISTTGFTAKWNLATDTANYSLQWTVLANN